MPRHCLPHFAQAQEWRKPALTIPQCNAGSRSNVSSIHLSSQLYHLMKASMPSRQLIDQDWYFSQVSSTTWPDVEEEWTPCASFPTSVHVELKKQGKIHDPFEGLNEWDVQCQSTPSCSLMPC
jgi:hypothetical protein